LQWSCFALNAASVLTAEQKSDDAKVVDFRYALPWWQTAICLPDDPDKTLVGKEGQLLFDFGRAMDTANSASACSRTWPSAANG